MTDYARDPNNLQLPVDRSFVDAFPAPQRFLLGIDPCSDEAYSWGDLGFTTDDDLPGMWSAADFEGGDPDERSYAERGWITTLGPFRLEIDRVNRELIDPLTGQRRPLCDQELDPKGAE